MQKATIGWIWLFVGVLASCTGMIPMKMSEGFSDAKLGLIGLALGLVAIVCWIKALAYLPLVTSWLVWEGLGTVFAVLVGAFFFHEKMTLSMVAYAGLIVVGCFGLSVTSQKM